MYFLFFFWEAGHHLPGTLGTTAASHQQIRHADIQELQQKTAGGNTHAAVVGEHPVQRHWRKETLGHYKKRGLY